MLNPYLLPSEQIGTINVRLNQNNIEISDNKSELLLDINGSENLLMTLKYTSADNSTIKKMVKAFVP